MFDDRIFDGLTQLRDSYLQTASAIAQVASANKYLDIGAGRWDGYLVLDLIAVEVASEDEAFEIVLIGSEDESDFSANTKILNRVRVGPGVADVTVMKSAAPSAALTALETLTGGTSSATCRFLRSETGQQIVDTIADGPFEADETLTGGTSSNTVVISDIGVADGNSLIETVPQRLVVPVKNYINELEPACKYVRIYTVCKGTIATGINFLAFLTK